MKVKMLGAEVGGGVCFFGWVLMEKAQKCQGALTSNICVSRAPACSQE